jgi:hypothetical protein
VALDPAGTDQSVPRYPQPPARSGLRNPEICTTAARANSRNDRFAVSPANSGRENPWLRKRIASAHRLQQRNLPRKDNPNGGPPANWCWIPRELTRADARNNARKTRRPGHCESPPPGSPMGACPLHRSPQVAAQELLMRHSLRAGQPPPGYRTHGQTALFSRYFNAATSPSLGA